MSFRLNGSQQMSLTDAVGQLTAREQKALEKSWAYGSAEGSSESWDSTISYNAVGDTGTSAKYILNTHTMKFHLPGCKYAGKISKKNYAESNESRDQLIAEGYSPCGECNP